MHDEGTARGRAHAKRMTVEVTTHDPGTWRPTMRRQVFEVAIEDKGNAVAAVRHHARADDCAAVVAIEELPCCCGLSPGRIRPRRASSTSTAQ
jgi:hypothetical protein